MHFLAIELHRILLFFFSVVEKRKPAFDSLRRLILLVRVELPVVGFLFANKVCHESSYHLESLVLCFDGDWIRSLGFLVPNHALGWPPVGIELISFVQIINHVRQIVIEIFSDANFIYLYLSRGIESRWWFLSLLFWCKLNFLSSKLNV